MSEDECCQQAIERTRQVESEEWVQRQRAAGLSTVNPPELAIYIIEQEQLPPDSLFFDAWEWADRVTINLPKARTIHMDRIRKKRNEELQKLDVPFMMASEKNDKITMEKISVQKQKLRDIPQKYDLSGFKTPEELKAFWPKELDERIKDVKKGL